MSEKERRERERERAIFILCGCFLFALQVPWRINTEVLDTVVTCLKEKIAVGDLPTSDDLSLPPPPEGVLTTPKGGFAIPKRECFESEESHKEAYKTMVEHRRTVSKVRIFWQLFVGLYPCGSGFVPTLISLEEVTRKMCGICRTDC